MNRVITIMIAIIIIGLSPLDGSPRKPLSKRDIFKKCGPAVVLVYQLKYNPVARKNSIKFGSGSIVTSRGLVITNHHVIGNAKAVDILLKGSNKISARNVSEYVSQNRRRKMRAKVIKSFPRQDIAFLQIQTSRTDFPTIPLGNSDKIEVGEEVIVIGHPRGYVWSMSRGIVSSVRPNAIQTDAAINPGNSGGPLLNQYGEVIGVNTYIIKNSQNLGFARPINLVKQLRNMKASSSSSTSKPNRPQPNPSSSNTGSFYYTLGDRYFKGKGKTRKNYSRALYWFKKAAAKGHRGAQNSLAYMYHMGLGTKKNHSQALYWLKKAAAGGDAKAQTNLAYMYREGKGISKNHSQALYWYQKAAQQGDGYALACLGYIYERGMGVQSNLKTAFTYYKRAAQKGNDYGQFMVGRAYEKGRGTFKSSSWAKYWYRKAARQGNRQAKEALKK